MSVKDPSVLFCLMLNRHHPQRSFPSDPRELAISACKSIERASGQPIDPATADARPFNLIAIEGPDRAPAIHLEKHYKGFSGLPAAAALWVITFHDVLAVLVSLQMTGLHNNANATFKVLSDTLEDALGNELNSHSQPGVLGASMWENGVVPAAVLTQTGVNSRFGWLEMRKPVSTPRLQRFRFLIDESHDPTYTREFIHHTNLAGQIVVPPLLLAEASRMKMEAAKADCSELRQELQSYYVRFTNIIEWFQYFQQRSYRELAELGSDQWEELRGKSQSLVQQLATLKDVVAQLDDVLVTTEIAKKNYLLIQEHWQLDSGSLAKMWAADADAFIDQIKNDIRYWQNLTRRIESVLDSVQFQLQLADPTLRKGFEMGKVLLPQFALMGALLSIALRVGFPYNNLWLIAAILTSAWVAGRLIGSSKILVHWQRVLGSAALASAAGAFLVVPIMQWTLGIWFIAFLFVYALDTFRVVRSSVKAEERRVRKEGQNRVTESELAEILAEHHKELQIIVNRPPSEDVARKLQYAREELYDLLAELPPTEIYRPKDFNSFLEKMTRKHYMSAAQIPDAIGVRYVVSPRKIYQYRNRVYERMQPRVVEESYHSFFSNGYRAIHLVIDLWGESVPVNGRKFPYMTAEIQIKTALNNAWANLGHDFKYKSVGTPNPVIAFVLTYSVLPFLRALSRIELQLYWNWMHWIKQYELKEAGLFLAERYDKMKGNEVYAFAVAEGSVADDSGVKKEMRLASVNGTPTRELITCVKMFERANNEGPFNFIFVNDKEPEQASVQLEIATAS